MLLSRCLFRIEIDVKNGYFINPSDGERITLGYDDLLGEKSYYLHVPLLLSSAAQLPSSSLRRLTDSFRYPLFFSFQYWSFPHGNFPSAWSETTPSGYVIPSEDNGSVVVPPSASELMSAVFARDGIRS